MIKIKRISLLITILIFNALSISAQYTFEEASTIIVTLNGDTLSDPFTGGFSNAQFGELDLNMDGINDLVVYDRFEGVVKPFINRGIVDSVSYYYAPQYATLFPEMDEFLLTADYNNDGLMDLYIGGSTISIYKNTSTTGLSFQFVEIIRSSFQAGGTKLGINPTASNIPGIYDIEGDNDIDLFINNSSLSVDYHRNLSVDKGNGSINDYERRSTCWGVFFDGLGQNRNDSIYLDTCYRRPFSDRGERIGSKNPSQQDGLKGLKHGSGLAITPLDYDNNGSTDLLIADSDAYGMSLLLNDDSIAPYTESRIHQIVEQFPPNDVAVDLLFPAAYLIDVNNDGKKDLLVASNQSNDNPLVPFSTDEILYYKNISSDDSFQFQLQTRQFLKNQSLDFGRASKPVFIDYNKDGLHDILVGGGGYLSPVSDSTFIAQLVLLENTGTASQPSFSLIDSNYLNIPNLNLLKKDTLFDLLSPSVGDIDGDGDQDLLITQKNGDVFLFEDTASTGMPAEFKFHPNPFQAIGNNFFTPISTSLYDLDNNGLLDLIANSSNEIQYFKNFGSATNAIFNIPLDSLYVLNGDTMRFHLSEKINFNLLKIGDTLATSNANQVRNNPLVPLKVSSIDTTNLIIDCISTIGGLIDSLNNEFNTTATLNYFNRKWDFTSSQFFFQPENLFFYRDMGINQLIVGGNFDGNNYLLRNFPDSLQPLDTFLSITNDFMTNYGTGAFVDGADINNDGFIDLIIGLHTGGLKVLYGKNTPIIFQASPSSLTIGADSASFGLIDITSNLPDWTVNDTISWLEVTPPNGIFNQTLRVTAIDSNSTGAPRTETLTILSPPQNPISISITQDTARTISLDEVSINNTINIYPNPTADQFIVSIKEELSLAEFKGRLFDAMGKEIDVPLNFNSDRYAIVNLEGQSKGIYFLICRYRQKVFSKKIMLVK